MANLLLPVIDTDSIGWTFNPPTDALASVFVQQSITVTTGGIQLVNDSTTPGNSQYYGTDAGGSKGYHALNFSTVTTRLRADANPFISGDITLISGTGIQLSQVANSVTVSSSGSGVTVQEIDGAPSVANLVTLRFPNGTLTDDGGGQATFRDTTTNRQTLTTNITFDANTARYQNLNPNGASRIVTLPALSGGLAFFVVNSGTASETITIKNAASVTVTTVANSGAASLICDGTVWIASPTTVTIV